MTKRERAKNRKMVADAIKKMGIDDFSMYVVDALVETRNEHTDNVAEAKERQRLVEVSLEWTRLIDNANNDV